MNYRDEVMKNCPRFNTDPIEKKLDLGGLGVAGEAGEVADLVKKILHHDVPLESVRDKLIKEMGDVHWYLEYLAATLGITTEQVLVANVAKLKERHPNGWSPKSQQEKRDEKTNRDKIEPS
jgi:NTP pyrophosphatase (non-canonical NTP hydrolase)